MNLSITKRSAVFGLVTDFTLRDMMKVLYRRKTFLCYLSILWTIGMIISVFLMGSNSPKLSVSTTPQYYLSKQQHLLTPRVISKVLHYCNPSDSISLGEEGRFSEDYQLESVQLLIRHGDRAPLQYIHNQSALKCSLNADKHLKFFEFSNFIKTSKHKRNVGGAFKEFPLIPETSECIPSHLTKLGALQHIYNGVLLQEVYIKRWNLISNKWQANELTLFSTAYSRTYQSAIAFLYGFLPNFDLSKVKMALSPSTRFCFPQSSCTCPHLDYLQKITDADTVSHIFSHPAIHQLLKKLNEILNIYAVDKKITSAVRIFDILMGYVCHGINLPCKDQNCITMEQITTLVYFLEWSGKQNTHNMVSLKCSYLKVHGLLTLIIQHMLNFTHKSRQSKFVLYSGHDVTLSPLAISLGIYDGNIPPYASRLIFELYSQTKNNKKNYFIRILYNGKDLTKETPFCPSKAFNDSKTLCPLDKFVNFVTVSMLRVFNTTSYEEACVIPKPLKKTKKNNH